MLDNSRWRAPGHRNTQQDLWAFFLVVDGNALWNDKNPTHFQPLKEASHLLETVNWFLQQPNSKREKQPCTVH